MPKHLFRFTLPKEKDGVRSNFTNIFVTEHHELYFATFDNGRFFIYKVLESLRTLIHPSLLLNNEMDREYHL